MGCSYKKENNGEINIIVKQREKTMSHNFTKRYMTCERKRDSIRKTQRKTDVL